MSSDASDGEKSEISLHRSESEDSDQSENRDRTEDSPPTKKKRTDKSESEEESGTSDDSDEDYNARVKIKSVVEIKEGPPSKKRREDSDEKEDRGSDDSPRRDRSDRRADDYDRRADSDREDSPRRRDRSDRRRGYYDDRRGNNPDRRRDDYDRRDDGYRRRDERRREDFDRRRNDDRDRQRERSPRGDSEKQKENEDAAKKEEAAPAKKDPEKMVQTKTGGAYIPPAKLRMMQQQMTDKSSEAFQQLSWEALKKSINGLINKVNVSNIKDIVMELFHENIVRGRGLLARSILTAQNASPTFTHVYAALVSIINTRFPQNGELILRRVVMQFRRSYRRNQKDICLHSVQFVAHLINQQVAHEILGLQILTLLLETPTDDSVEVAIGFLKECGQKLGEVSPRGLAAVFERLRVVLHEEQLEKRVQYMIEVMFAVRKDGFKEHPSVIDGLDLVHESDQFTHMLTVDDNNIKALETEMNVFKVDPDFLTSEENYKQIKKEILDESDGGSSGSGSSSGSESDDEEEEEETTMEITDKTETNLVALRRTIYLAVQSSLTFEECAHKILKMEFAEKDYGEICAMIIDCCSQLRTYEKFFGLLGGRFCMLKKEFMEHFELLFAQQYETIHRLETNKLRNVAKFFGHLLHSDAIPWSALANIRLSEDTTSSSSRIFIKILFQEITEYIGITKLNERLKDPTLAPFFEGIFPRDNPKDTRFAINFFTSIGLGGITDELREHLKVSAVLLSQKLQAEQLAALNASTSDDSSSEDSSPDEERKKKKSKKLKKRKTKKSKKQKKKKRKHKKTAKSSDSSSEEGSSSESESEKEIKKKSSKAKKKHKQKKEVEESGSSSAEEEEEEKKAVKVRSEKRDFDLDDVGERRGDRRSRRTEDTEIPPRQRDEGGRGNDQDRRQRSPDRGRHDDNQRSRRDFEQRRQSPDRRRNNNDDDARPPNRELGDRRRSPDRRRDNGRQRSPTSPGRRRDNDRNKSPDRSNRRRENDLKRSPDRSDRRFDNRRQRSSNSPDRRRENDVKKSPDRPDRRFDNRKQRSSNSPDRRRENDVKRSPDRPDRRFDNRRQRSSNSPDRRRENDVKKSPDRPDRRFDNRRQRSSNSPDRRRENDLKRSPDRSRHNDRSDKSSRGERRRSPPPPSRSYKEDRSRRDTRMDGKKKYIKPRSASVSSGSPSSGSESDSSSPPQSRRRPARSVSPAPRSRR